jgi:hypothetical protein
MAYTTEDFVIALERYPVPVSGLPEDIEPQEAAERFKRLKIPLSDPRIGGDPKTLFKGFFPKMILDESGGNILFVLKSYCHHPEHPGFPLTITEKALKYLKPE